MIKHLLCIIVIAVLAACGQQSVKDPASYPKDVMFSASTGKELCYEGVVYLWVQHGITVKFVHSGASGTHKIVPAECPLEQIK